MRENMKLGCNFSKELIQIYTDDEICIDYIKLPLENDIYYHYKKSGKNISIMIHGIPVRTGSS